MQSVISNSILIQWGYIIRTADIIITFPTAFNNTSYAISTAGSKQTFSATIPRFLDKTKTTVRIVRDGGTDTEGDYITIGF